MFRPTSPVTRTDMAAALVRSGLVYQYVAASPIFPDVFDSSTRNAVESVNGNSSTKLFYDAFAGQRFYPYNFSTRLLAAVAFVKAANLEGSTASTLLPLNVTDASAIPPQWRGYVAVALQNGFLTLDGNQFNPNRAITRYELAKALNLLVQQ